jgi:hypothetical protein
MGRLCAIAFVLLSVAAAGAGPAEGPTLEVQPASVEFSDAGPRPQVLAVLRNGGTEPLYDAEATAFPSAYAAAVVEPSTRPTGLPPAGEMSWTVTLPATLPRPIPDALRLRVAYQTGEPGRRIGHILTASVAVAPRKREALADVADVTLSGGDETVHDGQDVAMTLSVTNKSDTPLRVVDVVPSADACVSVPQITSGLPVVGPGHVALISVPGRADRQVRLGKRTLAVQVDLQWGPAGQEVSGGTVVTHDVTLAVAGAPEVLTALSVPSLLLLPGYLIVICYLTVAAWRTPEAAAVGSSLQLWKDVAKPGTLIVSLTLSFAMVAAYDWRWHRQIAIAYGWSDVEWLWVMSVAAGGGAGLVVQLGRAGRGALRRRSEAAVLKAALAAAYADTDTPLVVLDKLLLNGGSWTLPYMDQTVGRTFRLTERFPQPGRAWTVRSIQVDRVGASEPAVRLEAAMNAPDTVPIRDLVALLRDGASTCGWTLAWAGGAGPASIAADTFHRAGDAAFVEKA